MIVTSSSVSCDVIVKRNSYVIHIYIYTVYMYIHNIIATCMYITHTHRIHVIIVYTHTCIIHDCNTSVHVYYVIC